MSGAGWTTFGTSGNGVNQFSYPIGVYVASDGKIVVGDFSNQRVVHFDDFAGTNWMVVPGAFGQPRGVWKDSEGKIYVCGFNGVHRIGRVDDPTGANFVSFGANGNGVNQFQNPAGIWITEL